jgi:alanyl-tRNA synthetase
MRLLGSEELVLSELIKSSIQAMGPQYPELVANQDRILAIANAEEDTFLYKG